MDGFNLLLFLRRNVVFIMVLNPLCLELEGFFYSVVSLFHVVSFDEVKEVVDAFCSKIVDEGTPENAECRLKL